MESESQIHEIGKNLEQWFEVAIQLHKILKYFVPSFQPLFFRSQCHFEPKEPVDYSRYAAPEAALTISTRLNDYAPA